ncbi:MAG: peptidase dipeptidylpeptidase domain protein [Gemmatimonadetes bacterium]|nr:peptidase dipeptidylpeptidase domain protein [Gemmatimonadota bacterium]
MRSRSILPPGSRRLLLAITVGGALPLAAQAPAITAADYDRAARFLAPATSPLVTGGTVAATWLPDDRFWYRSRTAAGSEFVLVDAARRTRAPLFDHARLASALGTAAGATYSAAALPFTTLDLSADGRSVSFDVGTRRFRCDVAGSACATTGAAMRAGTGRRALEVPSPDGRRTAFIRDYNLWVRDLPSGTERQLTKDGVKDFGYATDNAGWVHSDRAVLKWSPDSRKIATAQQDERNVREMYLVPTVVGHPTLKAWKYPLVGDSALAMLHHVVVDADAGTVVRLQLPPQFHRGTIGDDITMEDYNWSPDGSRLALASTSRDHKRVTLRVADAATGAVRTVLEETAPTHFESRTGWRVLWPTNEVVWYSQRDDWGNLYLHDLTTGALKNRITTGEGPVEGIVRIDEPRRTMIVEALGRERGQDPYFRHYYRVGLDGTRWTSLTPDTGDHAIQPSPSGRYFVDSWSRPDVPPVVVLRDADGKVVMPLERADVSRLVAAGWKPPIPIVTKAADGKTDLYGLMFRPSNFDPSKRYPIINNPYPGPQSGSVGSRSFAAARGDRQALAELGFVVITVDGRGTPGRSKSFHDAYYGRMGRDNTIPDQVEAMRELGRRYPWVDTTRAGIYGHSGGGFITADAMFRYPDFFKAGIAESGNHDQRLYEDDWGERYQGLLVRNADGTDNYDAEANQLLAKNLKGHLLLAHGTMDDNVPPENTMVVVDALIKANKDFDLLMIPNAAHGYGAASNYMTRRRWDYFVTHLLGAQPPKEYEIRMPGTAR